MNFSSHFKKVYDKMKKGLNGLSMVKNQLTHNAKVLLYRGLIESHMNYCSLIWISNISKNKLKILRTIQKKALRIMRVNRLSGPKSGCHCSVIECPVFGHLFSARTILNVDFIYEGSFLPSIWGRSLFTEFKLSESKFLSDGIRR